MNTYRKTAVTVGMLFIVGTVSGIMAGVFTLPIMEDPSFPLNISANQNDWIIGTLLISLMGFSLAMVPVLLYPILKNYNKALALGAVLFRGAIEAISYAVMLICNFLLLTISETAGRASAVQPLTS